MEEVKKVPILAEEVAAGRTPEYLFWVGCAGSYDARAQKVSRAFVRLLHQADIDFAILGDEEQCTGDPARRAGNEFVFQMLAQQNITTLNGYGVKKIITTCPHCFNVFKNEYPELGGHYDVTHYATFLKDLLAAGKLSLRSKSKTKITYHDSCYLGRGNGIFDDPREVIQALYDEITELERSREKGLCCGAGGAQMFKEDEPGDRRINEERAEEIRNSGAEIVAANCPFCLTMLGDGIKSDDQKTVMVYDLSELILLNQRDENPA